MIGIFKDIELLMIKKMQKMIVKRVNKYLLFITARRGAKCRA